MSRANHNISLSSGHRGLPPNQLQRRALRAIALVFFAGTALAQIPPTITGQPQSQILVVGTTVHLSVTVAGTGPFIYQWQFNGTSLPNGVISTVVGGGAGDGGQATNANLFVPAGIAVDAAGNLFIGDSGNSRVRRVDTNGMITTIAGDGISGYSGDGGPATSARLSLPSDVVRDAAGNLFIGDAGNNCVRRVGTDGIITTVAGGKRSAEWGDGGAATNALLGGGPFGYGLGGIAVDGSGNLFIADSIHNAIRRVDTNGIISTVAGNRIEGYSGDGGTATNSSLDQPLDVAIDTSGNLFIADTFNSVVRKVDTNGIITTVAGNGLRGYSGDGGAATNARLGLCGSVLVESTGGFLIADESNRIRRVDTNGIIMTVAGNGVAAYSGDGGAATNASLNNPSVRAEDAAGNLFIADLSNDRIRRISSSGLMTTVAGSGSLTYSGDGLMATNATLNNPNGVAVDAADNLIILDSLNNRVRQVSPAGIITTVAGNGIQGSFGDGGRATNASVDLHQEGPGGAAADAVGNVFIVETDSHRIRKVTTNGVIITVAGNGVSGYSGDGGPATNASLNYPIGLTVDRAGDLFVADTYNSRIRKVDANGIITTLAGNSTAGYSGDGGPATNASLHSPIGVAMGVAGDLFVADGGNNRIRRVDTNGMITTFAGSGASGFSGDGGPATNAALYGPSALAVDRVGNLFVADTGNQCVRQIATNGTIVTVAGNRFFGYSGDGGAATDAEMASPWGLATDATGSLFIADVLNNRIRNVDFVGLPDLPLRKLTPADIGDYRVIVSNRYGSVTSAVARVTVLLPPLQITKVLSSSVLLVMTNSSPGATYVLESATNLMPPIQWKPVITNRADNPREWGLLDTYDDSYPARFYRFLQRLP